MAGRGADGVGNSDAACRHAAGCRQHARHGVRGRAADPEVVKYYADNDTTLLGLGPDKLPAFMESEAQKFKRIVDTAKIEVN